MPDPENPVQKTIFLACPIGEAGSETRERSDQLFRYIVAPTAEELGYFVERADQMSRPGKITDQIAKGIASADLLIADLTDLNANVMFELGLREGLRLPYVLLAQNGQSLPFDLVNFRTIFYILNLDGVEAARKELKKQIEAASTGDASFALQAAFVPITNEKSPSDLKGVDNRLSLLSSAVEGLTAATENSLHLQYEMVQALTSFAERQQELNQSLSEFRNQEFGFRLFQHIADRPESAQSFTHIMETLSNLQNNQVADVGTPITPSVGEPIQDGSTGSTNPSSSPRRQRKRR